MIRCEYLLSYDETLENTQNQGSTKIRLLNENDANIYLYIVKKEMEFRRMYAFKTILLKRAEVN